MNKNKRKKKFKAFLTGFCLTIMGTSCLLSCQSNDADVLSETTSTPASDSKEIISTEIKNFKIDGINILDPNGNEFLIKGVNVNGPGWVFPRDTLQDISLITDVWQFNTVRLCAAIGWEWAVNHNKDLDALIDAFTEKGIVVMLEVHDYTGIYPPQDEIGYRSESSKYIYPVSVLKNWWIDKAERFKDNPYVWFNIMNEPGSDSSKQSADSWFEIHDEIIEAIKNTGAENIIVLDEHGWGQGSGYRGGSSSYDSAIIRMGTKLNEKYDDLVYSLHVYDSWRDGSSRFNQYFKDARDLGLCVILGEFGVGTDNPSHMNAVKNMYNSAIPNNIGRIYWAWDDSGLPLTKNGGGWQIDKTNGDKPDNLTWAGELVWLDTHGLLTAPVPEYTLTQTELITNGDFENGLPGGWSNWGGSSIKDGASYNDSKALEVKSGATGGGGCAIELQSNRTYRFTVWGKNSDTTNQATDVGIKYRLNPNDAQEQHKFVSFTGTEWEQKTVTFTTPDELYGVTLFVWKAGVDVTFYLDDIELIDISDKE